MEKNRKRNESIEIKRILDILKSKKLVIALILIAFTVLGSVYSYHYVVPKYKSSSTLLLIPNTISEDKTVTNLELLINSELINTYSNIAKNPKVLRQTIDNLGLDMTEKQLLSKMQVDIIENTYIIQIAISDTNPQQAMNITKELSNVFLNEIKEIYNLNNIGIVDEAELPEQPYNINHIKDIILFLAMGAMASFACVMIIYIFDNTLKQEEDIENYIHVKNLGSIPVHINKEEIIDTNYAKSYITECINTIRTNILYMNAAKSAKTILITSCTPQEGKSWISANLATSFAKINKRVLLIDADMRKGRADKIFKVSNAKGLSNYLHAMTGDVKKDIILGKKYIKETQIPNLHILTNGIVPQNPSELLGSKNMKDLIALLKNVYDVIIVDAPPCKLVTDSIVLSTIIDSTVLVANTEKTKINDLNEVKKSIEGVGGEIIGAILNKKKVTQKTYNGNYYYGHSEPKHIERANQQEIISVNKVIKRAIIKLEKTGFDISSKENELIEEDIKATNQDVNQENSNPNYAEELNKILNQLEEVKQNNTTSEQMKEIVKEQISKLEDIQQEKLTQEQVQDIIREEILNLKDTEQEKLTQEQVQDIIREEISNLKDTEQEKLTQEQVQDIIREEILNLKDTEQEKLTQEQVQDIIREEISNLKDLEQEKPTKGQVRKIIRKELLNLKKLEQEKLTKEQIEGIIKQEVSHIDYTQDIEKIYHQIEDTKMNTSKMIRKIVKHNREQMIDTIKNKENHEQQMAEQIAQINDMLANLNDSYLELSNKLQNNSMEIQETSDIDNKKVIDFKALKKTKNKKKKAYLIEEDILYEELEKVATYIVPLEEKKDSDFSEEDYQNTMP